MTPCAQIETSWYDDKDTRLLSSNDPCHDFQKKAICYFACGGCCCPGGPSDIRGRLGSFGPVGGAAAFTPGEVVAFVTSFKGGRFPLRFGGGTLLPLFKGPGLGTLGRVNGR